MTMTAESSAHQQVSFSQSVTMGREEIFEMSSAIDAVRLSITGLGLDAQVGLLASLVKDLEARLISAAEN